MKKDALDINNLKEEYQTKAQNFMEKMKEKNPDASWVNLLTGLAILLVLSFASVWYFSKNNTMPVQDNNLLELVEDTSATSEIESGKVVVQAGEGLWHVAERVCGDGYQYVRIAAENGLSEWSPLTEGQELVVNCEAPAVTITE